jgi:putative transposase
MQILKAYRYRLKPTNEQELQLESYVGHCRFVWNKCWQMNIERLKNKQKIMYYYEMDFFSKLWKKSVEYGFLKECPAQCIQQKLKDLEKAFLDCFDKTQPNKKLPTKRKKNIHDSIRFPQPEHIELGYNRIKLPKLGWMKFFNSRKVEGTIRNVTISRHANHWYVSICVSQEQKLPKVLPTSSVGIDCGIANFATFSNGTFIAPVNSYRHWMGRLAILQRRLAKKLKFSNNWKKVLIKIRKLHSKIANIRRDFLHKLTTIIGKSHAMVVVEALKIKNMSKSAKGTLINPSKNVKAKSGLNKSILDQGWGEFKRQLKYKLEWVGGLLVEVTPQYTSQKCSQCGYTHKQNRTTQESFCCIACNYTEHADINAAKNILAAGHVAMACGASA